MLHNNSLLHTSEELLAPEIVQKMAIATGETIKKVREVLMSIVPAFTSKILEQGATFEGASHILEVVNEDAERTEIKKISEEISTDPTSEKILNHIGPTLFSTIKQEVSDERLSAYGLMRYFQEERDYASGLNPKNSEYYQLTGEDSFQKSTEGMRWYRLSFFLLIVTLSAFIFWLDKVLISP